MKNIVSFIVFVNKSDSKVKKHLALSLLSTIFQYASLAIMLFFLKIMVSKEKIINIINHYLVDEWGMFKFNAFIEGKSLDFLVLIMFIITFVSYGYLFLITKKEGSNIIKKHRDKVIFFMRDICVYDNSNVTKKEIINNHVEIYRRYFQIIIPFTIVIVGVLLISFVSIYYSIISILGFLLLMFIYEKKIVKEDGTNQDFKISYCREYLINKRKFLAQVVSVLFFSIILISIMFSNYTTDTMIVLIVVGRILLGNVSNFLHAIFEIYSKIDSFLIVKNHFIFTKV